MGPPISVLIEDGIAIITMQDGSNKNQLNLHFLQKLKEALEEVRSNPDVEALITTGVDRNFSQGIDLTWAATQNAETIDHFWHIFFDVLCTVLTFPMPTIAAINGHAYAGGAFLALAHDYRVMNTQRGWFSFNEIYMPSRFPEFLFELFRYKLPPGRLQTDVVTMGRRFTGKEALESGIVERACLKENLISKAKEIAAERLSNGSMPRLGVGEMKKDLYWPIIQKAKNWDVIDRPGAQLHLLKNKL